MKLKTFILTVILASLAACQNVTPTQTADQDKVIVINTFTLKAGEKPETVADLQLELVEKVKKPWKGFISQQTLIAQDGKSVTTVEAYDNFDTLKAIAAHHELVRYRERILQHATMNPVVYRQAGDSLTAPKRR